MILKVTDNKYGRLSYRQLGFLFLVARSPSSVGRSPRNFALWSEVCSI